MAEIRTTETWIIENDYKSYSDDYDIQLGRGRAIRHINYHSFSSTGSGGGGGFLSAQKGATDFSKQPARQAVIKVTGHKTSSGGLKAHVDYISRRGGIEVENETGEIFKGEERDNGFSDWVVDHEERMRESMINADKWKSGRIASSIVFTSPEETDTETLKAVVREFAQKHFGDRRYIFAVHAPDTEVDPSKVTPNPHIHLVVENVSPDAEKALEIEPETLRAWRRDYGDIAKEHGIKIHDLNKSRTRSAPHEKDMNVYQMLKRGEIPKTYQKYYDKAKERVNNNDLGLSEKEQKLVDRAKSEFIGRQRQIDDLGELMKSATLEKDRNEYQRQADYLKSVNSSIRMPMNNSQMFMKYAYEKDQRKQGKGSKYFYAAPTVKHFMFADRLAKSHGVKLPPMAHTSYKDLNKFINEYADRTTPKFRDLIKTIAKDRGLKVDKQVFLSHKAAMKWFKANKEIPTVKAVNYAQKIADKFNVDLPNDLTNQSFKQFISEYQSKVSPQMQSYAEAIAKRTGRPLDDGLFDNRKDLAKWIDEHKKLRPQRSHEANSMINRAKVNNEPDMPAREEPKKRDLSKEAKRTVKDLIHDGFRVSQSDIADDASVADLKSAYGAKKESNEWTRAVGRIDPDVNQKDRSKEKDKGREIER